MVLIYYKIALRSFFKSVQVNPIYLHIKVLLNIWGKLAKVYFWRWERGPEGLKGIKGKVFINKPRTLIYVDLKKKIFS